MYNKKRVKIFKARISKSTKDIAGKSPGTFTLFDSSIYVKTIDNGTLIEILELQIEGGSRMSSSDFYNGQIKNNSSISLIFETR